MSDLDPNRDPDGLIRHWSADHKWVTTSALLTPRCEICKIGVNIAFAFQVHCHPRTEGYRLWRTVMLETTQAVRPGFKWRVSGFLDDDDAWQYSATLIRTDNVLNTGLDEQWVRRIRGKR